MVVGGLGIGAVTWKVANVAEDVERISDPFPSEEARPDTPSAADDALTFLVVGLDRADVVTGGSRAEAVTLLRLTGDRRHAQVIAFPLDASVSEAGTTIDDAFEVDRPQGLVEAVETMTEVRIDHYVELDFDEVTTVVDSLGGISVDVPEPYQNLGHAFAAGVQQMDGGAAVAYLRESGTVATDAGAAARLQRVVAALFTRIGAVGAFSDVGRLTELLTSVTGAVSVSESLADEDLVAVAWEFRGVSDPDFLVTPVSRPDEGSGRVAERLDAEQARALWGYLREDALAGHLDEFR